MRRGIMLVTTLLVWMAAPRAGDAARFVHAVRPETEGLGGAIAATVSPDGRWLYVAGFNDDSLAVLGRDPVTGAVTFERAYFDSGSEAPAGEVHDGLAGCADVVVSPDGDFLYTAGWHDDGIGIYRRLAGGNLQFVGLVTDPALAGVSDLALSADGGSLWSTAYDAASVCRFVRAPATGALSQMSCVGNGSVLAGARALSLRPDGSRAWVAAKQSSSLSVVDDVGGVLQIGQSLVDGVAGADGLGGAYDVAVTADGADVYVAAFDEDVVGHFRLGQTGVYAYVAELGGADLVAPGGLWLPPPEDVLLVAGTDSDTMLLLDRDPSTGALTGNAVADLAAFGITRPVGFGGTADDRSVYLAGLDGGLLVLSPRRGIEGSGGAVYPLEQWLNQAEEQLASRAREIASSLASSYWTAVAGNGVRLVRSFPSSGMTLNPRSPVSTIELFATSSTAFAAAPGSGVVVLFSDNNDSFYSFAPDLTAPVVSATTLTGVTEMIFEPDGDQLYVVSAGDSSLHVYDLLPDRSLVLVQNVDPGTVWVDGATSLAISPDGANLYLTSGPNEMVTVFARDSQTGALTWTPGGHSFDPVLQGASAVRVSPDGANVYVCSADGDGLVVYDRGPAGGLSWQQYFAPGPGGVDWFDGATDIAIRPDGRQVWVAAAERDAVVGLRRDPTDGTLSRLGEIVDGVGRARGLNHPLDLSFAYNGVSLLVASDGAGLFGTFDGGLAVIDTDSIFADDLETGNLSAWSSAPPPPS